MYSGRLGYYLTSIYSSVVLHDVKHYETDHFDQVWEQCERSPVPQGP